MFFEYESTGRILVCAETPVKPGMVEIEVPQDFDQAEMHNWRVEDGVLVYAPPPVTPQPPEADRIAALEAQIASYELAYAKGVAEA